MTKKYKKHVVRFKKFIFFHPFTKDGTNFTYGDLIIKGSPPDKNGGAILMVIKQVSRSAIFKFSKKA